MGMGGIVISLLLEGSCLDLAAPVRPVSRPRFPLAFLLIPHHTVTKMTRLVVYCERLEDFDLD